MSNVEETIAAPATPPGRGGVGIIRMSGPLVLSIAEVMLKQIPNPREALFSPFKNREGEILDEGIALYFKAPHSFTGEEVLELQGHGGPVVLDRILQAVLALGARIAQPGEFSLRAFLNQKMDLIQAEAVADLIEASSERAAKLAVSSLKGIFSEKIHALVEALIRLRTYVEAAIDFPEEEIDFLERGKVADQVKALLDRLQHILAEAQQGVLIKEGMKLIILGKPNAGKSSLLNALAGEERAIVTEIPGTTRDVLREHLHWEGVPVHILDTAGLRETTDIVEVEGIRRALKAAREADRLLVVMDATDPTAKADLLRTHHEIFELGIPVTWLMNKVDLLSKKPFSGEGEQSKIFISAKTGEGLDHLKQTLLSEWGMSTSQEGLFLARTRHVEALKIAQIHLQAGLQRVLEDRAGELLAEELKQTQNALGSITGEFRADDLLGVIFSTFCIGK